MKGNIVVFPISRDRASVSEELAILKAQDLMINALLGSEASEDQGDDGDALPLKIDFPPKLH